MKKLICAGMLIVFFMAISGMSFGEETEGTKDPMKSMHCMMMKKMMGKEIVATQDGGVIVLVGHKLMKYDKDLNLLKEVEIEIDMKKIMEKCKKMMEKCGMDKGSMKESMGPDTSEKASAHGNHH